MISRAARVLLALVVLAVVVLVGGGYYFATQINAEALRVDPHVPQRDLVVVRVGPGSVVLRETGRRVEELHTAGTYGVRWPTGFGHVTGAPTGEREVTRGFRLLSGHLPAPGERVAMTQDAFPDDPSVALGRRAQEVRISAPVGELPAWYVPGGQTCVILVHGKGSSRTEMLRMMRVPVRLGMCALDITYRNDALVPQDSSRRYGYGRTEWEDLDAAVAWAQQHGARRVVLAGASMGGAIVAGFLERSDRTGVVRGVVLDAPVLSFEETIEHGAARRGLPVVGGDLPAPLTWTAKRFASLRYGVDWRAVEYLDDTDWLDVPALVFHGTSDDRVPFGTSARLAGRKEGFVRLERVEGAEHVEAWNQDPDRYEATLASFLVGLTRRAGV